MNSALYVIAELNIGGLTLALYVGKSNITFKLRSDRMECMICGEELKHELHFCPGGQTDRASLLSAGLVAPELKRQLDRLLNPVNAVTCQHRHGLKPRDKDLTRLANRQIEVEEALREMGY
jgi:hypothetical protein